MKIFSLRIQSNFLLGGGGGGGGRDFEPTFPTQFLLVHRYGLPLRESPIIFGFVRLIRVWLRLVLRLLSIMLPDHTPVGKTG